MTSLPHVTDADDESAEPTATGADVDAVAPPSQEELVGLSDHAEANQDDPAVMLPYGRALAAAGLHTEAIEVLLHGVRLGGESQDELRSALVDVLGALPDDDPRVHDARRRLAAALF